MRKKLIVSLLTLTLALLISTTALAYTIGGEFKGELPLDGAQHTMTGGSAVQWYWHFTFDAPTYLSIDQRVPSYGTRAMGVYRLLNDKLTQVVAVNSTSSNLVSSLNRSFEAGEYFLLLPKHPTKANTSCLLTCTVKPLGQGDAEPNDTPEQAIPLRFGQAQEGIIMPSSDVDCYSFTLDAAGPVQMEMRSLSGKLSLRAELLKDGTALCEIGTGSRVGDTDVRRLYLSQGDYIIAVKTPASASATGDYTLCVRKADPVTSSWLPKTAKVTIGLDKLLPLQLADAYTNLAALNWTSSNAGVATVSPYGVVTAIAPGATTIQVSSPDGTLSGSCKVTARVNAYTRKKPYIGRGRAVYSSTKKLYYVGDTLNAELFVYNKLGKTFKFNDENYYGVLYEYAWDDDEEEWYPHIMGTYWFEDIAPLANGKTRVMKFQLPLKDVSGKAILDLPTGKYQVVLLSMDDIDYITDRSAKRFGKRLILPKNAKIQIPSLDWVKEGW